MTISWVSAPRLVFLTVELMAVPNWPPNWFLRGTCREIQSDHLGAESIRLKNVRLLLFSIRKRRSNLLSCRGETFEQCWNDQLVQVLLCRHRLQLTGIVLLHDWDLRHWRRCFTNFGSYTRKQMVFLFLNNSFKQERRTYCPSEFHWPWRQDEIINRNQRKEIRYRLKLPASKYWGRDGTRF